MSWNSGAYAHGNNFYGGDFHKGRGGYGRGGGGNRFPRSRPSLHQDNQKHGYVNFEPRFPGTKQFKPRGSLLGQSPRFGNSGNQANVNPMEMSLTSSNTTASTDKVETKSTEQQNNDSVNTKDPNVKTDQATKQLPSTDNRSLDSVIRPQQQRDDSAGKSGLLPVPITASSTEATVPITQTTTTAANSKLLKPNEIKPSSSVSNKAKASDPKSVSSTQQDVKRNAPNKTTPQHSPVSSPHSILKNNQSCSSNSKIHETPTVSSPQSFGILKTPSQSSSHQGILKKNVSPPVSLKPDVDTDNGEDEDNYCIYCKIKFTSPELYCRHTQGLMHTQKVMKMENSVNKGHDTGGFKASEATRESTFFSNNDNNSTYPRSKNQVNTPTSRSVNKPSLMDLPTPSRPKGLLHTPRKTDPSKSLLQTPPKIENMDESYDDQSQEWKHGQSRDYISYEQEANLNAYEPEPEYNTSSVYNNDLNKHYYYTEEGNDREQYKTGLANVGITQKMLEEANIDPTPAWERDLNPEDCGKKQFPNDYQCKLCNVKCTGAQSFQAHLSGAKHTTNVETYYSSGKSKVTRTNFSLVQSFRKSLSKELLKLIREPVIGLSYITEFHKEDPKAIMTCVCNLCESKCDEHTIVSHILGVRHRLNYMKEHHQKFYEHYKKYGGKKNQSNYVEELSHDMQNMDGKGEPVVKLIILEKVEEEIHASMAFKLTNRRAPLLKRPGTAGLEITEGSKKSRLNNYPEDAPEEESQYREYSGHEDYGPGDLYQSGEQKHERYEQTYEHTDDSYAFVDEEQQYNTQYDSYSSSTKRPPSEFPPTTRESLYPPRIREYSNRDTEYLSDNHGPDLHYQQNNQEYSPDNHGPDSNYLPSNHEYLPDKYEHDSHYPPSNHEYRPTGRESRYPPNTREPLIQCPPSTTQNSQSQYRPTSMESQYSPGSREPLIHDHPGNREPLNPVNQMKREPLIQNSPITREPLIQNTPQSREPLIQNAPNTRDQLFQNNPKTRQPLLSNPLDSQFPLRPQGRNQEIGYDNSYPQQNRMQPDNPSLSGVPPLASHAHQFEQEWEDREREDKMIEERIEREVQMRLQNILKMKNPQAQLGAPSAKKFDGGMSNMSVLMQSLSNSLISNEDEAEMALQVSNALTQALLKYRLKTLPAEMVRQAIPNSSEFEMPVANLLDSTSMSPGMHTSQISNVTSDSWNLRNCNSPSNVGSLPVGRSAPWDPCRQNSAQQWQQQQEQNLPWNSAPHMNRDNLMARMETFRAPLITPTEPTSVYTNQPFVPQGNLFYQGVPPEYTSYRYGQQGSGPYLPVNPPLPTLDPPKPPLPPS